MILRPLDPATERPLVLAFLHEAADYIALERGAPPDDSLVEEFFTDAPPGSNPAESLRLGLFDQGHLVAIAEMGWNHPGPTDAYLGLLIVSPAARGRGLGQHVLRHLEDQARARGKTALYLAVLDANPRGRAFWEREGFRVTLPDRQVTLGEKTQIAHRMGKDLGPSRPTPPG